METSSIWLDQLQRLGLALAVGFLVGIERGWKQRDEPDGGRVAGLRTFALAGLLGGVAGLILPIGGPILTGAIALAFALAFIAFTFQHRATERDRSVTSTVAGLLVFALGLYATIGSVALAAAAAVAATLLLAFKDGLHGWLRSLAWEELRSALVILTAAFIILPLLPEAPVDPWGVLDLRALWLMTIFVRVASFGGYVALRTLGPSLGLLAGGAVGALVSSTAVTLDLARRVRLGELQAAPAAATAALATVVSAGRTLILAFVFSLQLGWALLPGLGAACLVWTLGATLILGRRPGTKADNAFASVASPLNLLSVGRFAGILATLTVVADLAGRTLGKAGLIAFAATAGLVDVDAVTLSVGKLVPSDLGVAEAAGAVGLALHANQAFKVVAVTVAGSKSFAGQFLAIVIAGAWAGALAHMMLSS